MQPVLAWDHLGRAPAGWASHVAVPWAKIEPRRGQYYWAPFDEALARSDRPCHLQLLISLYDRTLGYPVDLTPPSHKRSLILRVGGLTGEIPPYDAAWTAAYSAAIQALAARYAGQAQVASYWHAPGWNQETQAAVATNTGDWAAAVQPLLCESIYLASLLATTRAALAAWGSTPVYLPGAPSPGSVWGHRKRELIVQLLQEGAGYLNCGLMTDNSNAYGCGVRAGQGMYDIAGNTPRRGFEEGTRCAPGEPLELYWWLLRARHWDAQFVNLYESLSAPDYAQVAGLLPAEDMRWIVFRDAEYPPQTYTSGGNLYGYQGEPGCWGAGLRAPSVTPTFNRSSYRYDRWRWDAAQPFLAQAPGLADGRYQATIWRPDGALDGLIVTAQGEWLSFPAGSYHRIDVGAQVQATLAERVAALEARVSALENAPQGRRASVTTTLGVGR